MTLNIIVGILGGISFLVIGIGGIILSSKKKQFLIPLFIGSWILYIHTLGPLAESNMKLDRIINVKSDEVEVIILKASIVNSKEHSLMSNSLEIRDKESINEICQVLNEAEKIHDGYVKSPEWLVQMEIKKSTSHIYLGVRKKEGKTSIKVTSNGEYGWNYGTLKCDRLGKVLENIYLKNSAQQQL